MTSLKINQVAQLFKLCFEAKVTPALVSTSGLGKTSICKQLAPELGFTDGTIILRPSLVADVGDLVGLPDFVVIDNDANGREIKRTTFNAPDWLPKEGEKKLIVVDEINRTQKEIIMAMFDLIEADHPKIGGYSLPDTCKVVTTLNPPTDNYQVLDIKDSAFTSRLCFIKLQPDRAVFTEWGKQEKNGVYNVDPTMVNFLNDEGEKFFGLGEDFSVEMFFSNGTSVNDHIRNNNRSKTKISHIYAASKKLSENGVTIERDVLLNAMIGLGGLDFATAYLKFAENIDKVVLLKDLIGDDSEKELERFDYSKQSNVAMILEQTYDFVEAGSFKKTKHSKPILTFLENIPLDVFKGFVEKVALPTNEEEDGNLTDKAKNFTKFTDVIAESKAMRDRIAKFHEVAESSEETKDKSEE